jgi:hypothetical protein
MSLLDAALNVDETAINAASTSSSRREELGSKESVKQERFP